MLHAVGLQAERPPHPRDRRLRHAGLARHLARGPVRAAVRRHRLQRLDDHLLDLLVAHRPRPARPRLVDQPVQPALGEPRPPLRHRRTAHPDPQRDLRVALTLRARQHDPRALRQPRRRPPPARPPLQLPALAIAQPDLDRSRPTRSHAPRLPETTKKLKTQYTSQAAARRAAAARRLARARRARALRTQGRALSADARRRHGRSRRRDPARRSPRTARRAHPARFVIGIPKRGRSAPAKPSLFSARESGL